MQKHNDIEDDTVAHHYPISCTSAFCGKIRCAGCRHEPERLRFEKWRERTKAYQPDPIWSSDTWLPKIAEPPKSEPEQPTTITTTINNTKQSEQLKLNFI